MPRLRSSHSMMRHTSVMTSGADAVAGENQQPLLSGMPVLFLLTDAGALSERDQGRSERCLASKAAILSTFAQESADIVESPSRQALRKDRLRRG